MGYTEAGDFSEKEAVISESALQNSSERSG
jgi:hypothetical protein